MMRRGLGKYLRREDGTATVEFVIMFPLIMTVFMSMFEAAVLTTRYTMLERALDITVRGLRLNTGTAPTHAQVRDKICEIILLFFNIMWCINNLEYTISRTQAYIKIIIQ